MSFLVASGHVEVEARTGDARRDIERFVSTMGGISPTATAASQALDKLRTRAATSGAALTTLGTRAERAERRLVQLRAAAGDIKISAQLDDQTSGGAAAVKAALRDLKAEGPIELRVTLDNNTASGVATTRAALRDLRDESPVRLAVVFDGQAPQITATAGAMSDLRNDAQRAATAMGPLATGATTATAALHALESAAEGASRELGRLRVRAVEAAAALAELRARATAAGQSLGRLAQRAQTVEGRMEHLSGRMRTAGSDTRDLDEEMRRLVGTLGLVRGGMGGVGGVSLRAGGGMSSMLRTALMLSPALIPIAASLVPIVAGAGAATVALGAFGAAIIPQIQQMSEASKAQEKYEEALREHGRASEEATKAESEYLALVKRLPPETRVAAAAVGEMKDDFRAWSNDLAGYTMPVATKSMAMFSALFPKMKPLVMHTSRELERFVTIATGGIQSQGFDAFMNRFDQFASGTLTRANDALIRFSRTMDGGAVNSDIQQFMDYARANGPLVAETLGNLGKAIIHLVVAASDVGVSILTVANALAKLVNAVPTSVITTLLQLALAIKAAKLAAAGLGAAGTAMTAFSTRLTTMRTASTAAGGGLTGLSAAMGTLSRGAKIGLAAAAIAGFVLVLNKLKNSKPAVEVDALATSLNTLVTKGKVTGELKSNIDEMSTSIAMLGKGASNNRFAKMTSDFGTFVGIAKGPGVSDAIKMVDAWDKAMASNLRAGHAKEAAEQFDLLRKAWRAGNGDMSLFKKHTNDYRDALANARFEEEVAAQAMGAFGQQAQETGRKLDSQKQSADGLRQSIQALNDVNRAGLGGMNAFEQGIDDLAKVAKESGGALGMVRGELNLNSQKARDADNAMRDLAQKTDEAAGAARESGASWQKVNGIYSRGRSELLKQAQAMGLSKKEAQQYVSQILKIPSKKSTLIEMKREDAIAGLKDVQAKIKQTPGAKRVVVSTLNGQAIQALHAVGLKTKQLPNGKTAVYTANGQALGSIGAVKSALNNIPRQVTTTVSVVYTASNPGLLAKAHGRAAGGPAPRYAGGGEVQAYPFGGQVQGPGTPTSDSILAMFANGPAYVSDTEYIMRAAAVRRYGVDFMNAVNTGTLSIPGFAKGGKVSAKERARREKAAQKRKEEERRQREGRSALTSDVTFTTGGKLAGYKNAEVSRDLGTPDSVSDLVSSINSYLGSIRKAFEGKKEDKLEAQLTKSGRALIAHQRNLEKVTKSLEAARDKLDDLKGQFDSLKDSIKSGLVDFANISKVGKWGTSVDVLLDQMRSDTSRTGQFASQLEQLKAKGLNPQMLADIAGAGVTGGGMATAASLLTATPEQIAELNALQKKLESSATKAGTVTADAMYGAGIRAAEGLVKGLEAKQKSIEDQMMKIAKAMEKAIKKALGIRSPAKVMEPVGEESAAGVEVGWMKRLKKGKTLLSGSAGRFAKPALPSTPAGPPPAAGGGIVVNTLNVNVSGTFDFATPAERKAAANALVRDMNEALRTYQKERA